MKALLSDEDLVSCLENIREEIQGIESLNDGKVIFLNLDSFYAYIDDVSFIKRGSNSGIKHHLALIEPYIPITVSEKYIELFMTAASKKDTVFGEDINIFLEKVIKINFINQIHQARTPDAWAELIKICCAVRDMYDEESSRRTLYSEYFSQLF
ncbi:MAG: hypothetical protein LBU77_03150 [Clostridiales bacterium]|jgi:hypothetical protein|nr:hypothetical protein [Clostridiales bacterium]